MTDVIHSCIVKLINNFYDDNVYLEFTSLVYWGKGMELKLHADNLWLKNPNKQHHTPQRDYSSILYLNDNWKTSYNGNLELWNTELTKAEVEIEPISNRMICFNTQPDSGIAYHGHPKPLNVPSWIHRKSIALYYYTKEKPNNIFSEKHNNVLIK